MPNLRLAWRTLRRSPAFTTVTVLTMAVAIGATTTMFSVFDRLVLNAVTVHEPSTLVTIWFNNPQRGVQNPSSSVPRYYEMRDHLSSFSSMSLSAFDSFTLIGWGHATQLNGLRVSANFFPTLGVQPARGRNFRPEEDIPNGPAVAILSHEAWQSQFGGREDLVGSTVDLNGTAWEVIGILPPNLTAPFRQTHVFVPRVAEVSALTPVQIEAGATFAQPIARLKPGVTIEQARQELVTFSEGYRERYPSRLDALNISEPRPFASMVTAGVEPTMYTLLGAVGCVLLIALANVASLFLTRLLARRKEVAVRLSLGADRAAIVRQCLAESLAFSGLAGIIGTLLAMGALRILTAALAPQLPPDTVIALNWRVLLFTAAITMVSAVLVGLFPALQASRPGLVDSLKDSARGSSSAQGARLRQGLIVVEVMLSVVLLVGAGLLLVSFLGLQRVDPGFRASGSAAAFVSLSPSRYGTPPQQSQFVDDVIERLRAQPGVTGAAVALSPPLSGFSPRMPYGVVGQPIVPLPERPLATVNMVSDDYFRLLEIPFIGGRHFSTDDRSGAPRVCVVNDTFARRLFGGEPAVGRQLHIGRDGQPPVNIVGVIRDVRSIGLNVPPPDEIYFPLRQLPRPGLSIIAKTGGDAATLQPAIQAAVEGVDKTQAISFFATLDTNVSTSIGNQQLLATLTVMFASLALGLAVMGLYSVLAYLVAQRTNEIGIRMALGASRGQVVGLVMRNGMFLVGVGLVLGLGTAAAASRLIQQLLFGVTPFSPMVYVSVAAVFGIVAALACAAPSWRASRIDPLAACRTE